MRSCLLFSSLLAVGAASAQMVDHAQVTEKPSLSVEGVQDRDIARLSTPGLGTLAARCAQESSSHSQLVSCVHREFATSSFAQAQSQQTSFFRRHLELFVILGLLILFALTFRIYT